MPLTPNEKYSLEDVFADFELHANYVPAIICLLDQKGIVIRRYAVYREGQQLVDDTVGTFD